MTNELTPQDGPDLTPEEMPLNPVHCHNCGRVLMGEFCSGCGQAAVDIQRPLTAMITDFAGGLVSIEHSLWQTLRLLLLRPGELTNEFLRGRRMRYMSPIRLYLISSLVFFSFVGLVSQDGQVVIDGEVVPEDGSAAVEMANAETDSTGEVNSLPGWMDEGTIERIRDNPDAFKDRLRDWLPRSMFVLVPLAALLLRLMYIRRHRPYLDFLVFALHVHAVFYLTAVLCGALAAIPHTGGDIAAVLLFLTIPANIFLAQKRVFGGGQLKTFAKLFVVWHAYGVLQLAAVLALLGLVYWRT